MTGQPEKAASLVLSVAEIIGWRCLDDIGTSDDFHDGCCTARWEAPDGEVYDGSCIAPEVTVDDMLAWLRGDSNRYVQLRPSTLLAGEQILVVVGSFSAGEQGHGRGNTLYEALEATVRLMAAQDNTDIAIHVGGE